MNPGPQAIDRQAKHHHMLGLRLKDMNFDD